MLKTAALAALVLLDDIKPKPVPRAEKYITDRVPMLELVPDVPELPKVVVRPRKPRKRHVCTWTDREVWGACALTFVLGAFLSYVIF